MEISLDQVSPFSGSEPKTNLSKEYPNVLYKVDNNSHLILLLMGSEIKFTLEIQ